MFRTRSFRVTLVALAAYAVAFSQPWTLFAQAPAPSKVKFATIAESDMRDFLGTLASDAFQGRQIYTEGYGLAAAYVADHLKQWGVKPMGDDGTYFQSVKNRGYRVTRNSQSPSSTIGQSKHVQARRPCDLRRELGRQADAHLQWRRVRRLRHRRPSERHEHHQLQRLRRPRRERPRGDVFMNGTPQVLTQGGRGRAGGNRPNYALQTRGCFGGLHLCRRRRRRHHQPIKPWCRRSRR